VPIFALLALIRVIVALTNQSSSGRTAQPISTRFKVRVGSWIVSTMGVSCLWIAALEPTVTGAWAVALVVLGVQLLLPWPITRALWIPLGMPRVAFFTSLHPGLGNPAGGVMDPLGVAALAAALAVYRKRVRSERDLAFVDRCVERSKRLGGAGVVAAGLLAAMRGDAASARAILRGAGCLPKDSLPWAAFEAMTSWLAADHAARGAWGDLASTGFRLEHSSRRLGFWLRATARCFRAAWRLDAERLALLGVKLARPSRIRAFFAAFAVVNRDLGDRRLDRLTPFTERFLRDRSVPRSARLLGRIALRLVASTGAPTDRAVWMSWALAPGRSRSRALVRRALAVPVPSNTRRFVLPEGDSPWKLALATLVKLDRTTVGPYRIVLAHGLARALDGAFESEALPALLARRGAALDVAPQAAIAEARARASSTLALMTEARRIPLEAIALGGPVSGPAAELARERLIATIVELASEVGRRVESKRLLPRLEEWAAFGRVVDAYERGAAFGGPGVQLLAWRSVHPHLCALAVATCNLRLERTLAHGMFTWLLNQAETLGDPAGIDLQKKNVRASRPT
jgi:hypothetical protein